MIPQKASLIKMVQQLQKKHKNAIPANPEKLETWDIPDEWKKLSDDENSLFYDSGKEKKNRVIIFSSKSNMKIEEELRNFLLVKKVW